MAAFSSGLAYLLDSDYPPFPFSGVPTLESQSCMALKPVLTISGKCWFLHSYTELNFFCSWTSNCDSRGWIILSVCLPTCRRERLHTSFLRTGLWGHPCHHYGCCLYGEMNMLARDVFTSHLILLGVVKRLLLNYI